MHAATCETSCIPLMFSLTGEARTCRKALKYPTMEYIWLSIVGLVVTMDWGTYFTFGYLDK